jgi:integrase
MRELLKEIPRRSEKLFDLNNLERPKAKKNNLCNIMKRFLDVKKHLPFLRRGERFHIFRHTAITRWANSGVPLPVVQKWAGHSSVEMTMKYVHPSDSESVEWMKKFSDLTRPGDAQ